MNIFLKHIPDSMGSRLIVWSYLEFPNNLMNESVWNKCALSIDACNNCETQMRENLDENWDWTMRNDRNMWDWTELKHQRWLHDIEQDRLSLYLVMPENLTGVLYLTWVLMGIWGFTISAINMANEHWIWWFFLDCRMLCGSGLSEIEAWSTHEVVTI